MPSVIVMIKGTVLSVGLWKIWGRCFPRAVQDSGRGEGSCSRHAYTGVSKNQEPSSVSPSSCVVCAIWAMDPNELIELSCLQNPPSTLLQLL